MFGLDDFGGLFNQAGGWLEDLGEFAQDAQSVVEAVQGFTDSGSSYRTPGIVPFGVGVQSSGPAPGAASDASGLVLLGLAGVAAYFLLKRG